MPRMNSRVRKRLYGILRDRDGERCRICRRRGNEKSLVIDHLDNNNDNNELSNLQLLCRRDNSRKNPRGPARRKILSPVSVRVCELDTPQISSAEYSKNQEAEPLFRHWLYDNVRTLGEIEYQEAIDCGAEIANCSQESVKRYIRKLCSSVGIMLIEREADERIFIRLRKAKSPRIQINTLENAFDTHPSETTSPNGEDNHAESQTNL